MYKPNPALGKEDLKNIFIDVRKKLEKGFLFSIPKNFKDNLQRAIDENYGNLKDEDLEILNGSHVSFKPVTRVKKQGDKTWIIKTRGKKYVIIERDKSLELYSVKNPIALKANISEIKGILLEEIVKRDKDLIFISRKGLSFTVDSIDEWKKNLGKNKAEHKEAKRLKKYKERVDNLFKKARKKAIKEKVGGLLE